ncbi:MAG: RnfABCDGE type electron transport complex subunit G [Bacteroidales bacterium]|nr:RnfABCDGE type electron transport complex subunit G [Bacteroidales bacterium]
MKSTILSMSLVLLVIASLSSGLLAYVYSLTKDAIDLANKQKKIEALTQVMPEFYNSPIDEAYKIASDGDSLNCYLGKDANGEVIGIAIETYTDKAFSGKFTVMVGLQPDGVIYNTIMLEHQETPGLGDKAEKNKSDWSNQYNGKNPSTNNIAVTKDGGEIDGITAATISSRAYSDAVQRAYNAYMNEVKPNLGL